MTAGESALALAARGLAVFPARADKRPACPHGLLDASTFPGRIADLWRDHPAPLIGVRTGEPSDLAVIDLDAKHPEARAWWAVHRDRLPKTRTHRTRSGGLHLLFRHQPGLRCSTSRLAVGIDVKAEGGCFIWWPAAGLPVLCNAEPAPWPAWIVHRVEPARIPALPAACSTSVPERRRCYAEAALRHAIERVATAGNGARNAALNREAFGLMRLAAEGALAPAEIADALAIAAMAAGLDQRETASTIASALRGGGRR